MNWFHFLIGTLAVHRLALLDMVGPFCYTAWWLFH